MQIMDIPDIASDVHCAKCIKSTTDNNAESANTHNSRYTYVRSRWEGDKLNLVLFRSNFGFIVFVEQVECLSVPSWTSLNFFVTVPVLFYGCASTQARVHLWIESLTVK